MNNGKPAFLDLDVSKAFQGFALPGFDMESLMASQRKNLEALTQANQLAVEGVRAVTRRQAEIAREAMEEVSSAFRDLTHPGAPEERIAKNAALAKQAFQKSIAHARELTELASKANSEAFEVIANRVSESFEELGSQAKRAR